VFNNEEYVIHRLKQVESLLYEFVPDAVW